MDMIEIFVIWWLVSIVPTVIFYGIRNREVELWGDIALLILGLPLIVMTEITIFLIEHLFSKPIKKNK